MKIAIKLSSFAIVLSKKTRRSLAFPKGKSGTGEVMAKIILVPTAVVPIAVVYAGYAALGVGIGRLLATTRRRLTFNRGVGSAYILAGIGLASVEPSAAASTIERTVSRVSIRTISSAPEAPYALASSS